MKFNATFLLALLTTFSAQAFTDPGIVIQKQSGEKTYLTLKTQEDLYAFDRDPFEGEFKSACYYGTANLAKRIVLQMAENSGIMEKRTKPKPSYDESGWELPSAFSVEVKKGVVIAYANYEFADLRGHNFEVLIPSCEKRP